MLRGEKKPRLLFLFYCSTLPIHTARHAHTRHSSAAAIYTMYLFFILYMPPYIIIIITIVCVTYIFFFLEMHSTSQSPPHTHTHRQTAPACVCAIKKDRYI